MKSKLLRRRLLTQLTTYKRTLQSCASSEGPGLGMHSDPMGKTLIVGGNRASWFAGTMARFLLGVRLRRIGITFGVVARSVVPFAAEAGIFTVSHLAALGALLLGLLVVAVVGQS